MVQTFDEIGHDLLNDNPTGEPLIPGGTLSKLEDSRPGAVGELVLILLYEVAHDNALKLVLVPGVVLMRDVGTWDEARRAEAGARRRGRPARCHGQRFG